MPTDTRRLVALCAAAVAMTLPACSIISSENHVSYTGNYVPSDSLSQIRVGESTPEYTAAILGEPTSKSDLDDGTSIWRLGQAEVINDLIDYFLLAILESPGDKTAVDHVLDHIQTVITAWKLDLAKTLDEVLEQLENENA